MAKRVSSAVNTYQFSLFELPIEIDPATLLFQDIQPQRQLRTMEAPSMRPIETNHLPRAAESEPALRFVNGRDSRLNANVEAIRMLYQLNNSKRRATAREKEILRGYTSFGAIPQIFATEHRDYELLQELLTPEHYAAARTATPNSFYTQTEIVAEMWRFIEALGFGGGIVLEPAMATGNFFTAMPSNLRSGSEMHGVELDSLAAQIGAQLHPYVQVQSSGLQTATVFANYYDLTLSNVPFGDYPVYDKAITRELSRSIHNYFLLKMARLTRPGGIVAAITSRYSMDSRSATVREALAAELRLLAAVRLPTNAFQKYAGCSVITDMLFFQKQASLSAPDWLETQAVELEGPRGSEEFNINPLFAPGNANVIGRYVSKSGAYAATLHLEAVDDEPLPLQIRRALATFAPGRVYTSVKRAPKVLDTIEVPAGLREGEYFLVKGFLFQKDGPDPISITRHVERAKELLLVAAAAYAVLAANITGSDEALQVAQNKLTTAYVCFGSKFRNINDQANRLAFKGDPRLPFLLALERSEDDTYVKADIFSKRVVGRTEYPARVELTQDAVTISLERYGKLDWAYMATLTGKTDRAIQKELYGTLLYQTPDGNWQTATEYLSGNVRTKLRQARQAAAENPLYQVNVAALEKVMPEDISSADIYVALGATWVEAAHIERFVFELLDPESSINQEDLPEPYNYALRKQCMTWKIHIKYMAAVGHWRNDGGYSQGDLPQQKWGTYDMPLMTLINNILNNRPIAIYDIIDDKRVLNQDQTLAAREKAKQIQDAFRRWLWLDPTRNAELVTLYNEKFNSFVRPTHDGSKLQFPGLNPNLKLRPNQQNAVARALLESNLLEWQKVGFGKTLLAITATMELKRLGIRRKAMHAVLNSTTEQYAAEFLRAYPTAKILVISSDEMSPKQRQRAMFRMATEDWDAIIIPHTSFDRIPLAPATIREFRELRMKEIAALLAEIERERPDDKKTIKMIEKKRLRLEEQYDSMIGKINPDQTMLYWENLGIDLLIIDECFPWKTLIMTDQGMLPIGYVVDNRLPVNVLSRNLNSGALEWKPITRWLPRPSDKQMVRVVHARGSFVCTADHKVWTEDKGYVRAKDLSAESTLCALRREDRAAASLPLLPGRLPEGPSAEEPKTTMCILRQEDRAAIPLPFLPERLSQGLLRGESNRKSKSESDLRRLWKDLPGREQPRLSREKGILLERLPQECPEEYPEGNNYQNMPAMPGTVHIQFAGQNSKCEADLLRKLMQCEMATSTSHNTSIRRKAGTQDTDVRGTTQGQFRTDETRQSGQATRSSSQGQPSQQGKNVPQSGGQFADHNTATIAGGSIVPRSVHGICDPNQSRQGKIRVTSHLLQGAYSRPGTDTSDRSGWKKPRHAQMEILGPAENSGFECIRVVGVEILERGSYEQPRSLCGEGQKVYDIEVADNHNFFAEGVLVSNCHQYKNLYVETNNPSIPGVTNGESGRAYHLFMKTQWMTRRCAAGHILGYNTACPCGAARMAKVSFIGMTGTALSNSIAEIYTWQRYFAYDTLLDMNIQNFDAWAAQFGETADFVEMKPTGNGWQTKTRFARFRNAVELMNTFCQFAEIQFDPTVNGIILPTVEIVPVDIEPSATMLAYIETLDKRAELVKRTRDTKDNMLVIMGDALKAGTDMRLINPSALAEVGNKIDIAIHNIYRIWSETRAVMLEGLAQPANLTQSVFLNIGVPDGACINLYQWIKDNLVARGIPETQIAFMHSADTPIKKKELLGRMNSGSVAIILGSDGNMGAGVNMQRLLIASHDIDAPWNPLMIEQRAGRIVRQGNLNQQVKILRYVTKQSLDFHRWHLIETKMRSYQQLTSGRVTSRTMDDIDNQALTFGQLKAIATGDPRIMEKIALENQLRKLAALRANHAETGKRQWYNKDNAESTIKGRMRNIENLRIAIELRDQGRINPIIQMDDKIYSPAERKEAIQRLATRMLEIEANKDMQYRFLYNDHVIAVRYNGWTEDFNCAIAFNDEITYFVTLSKSASGSLTRIDNFLDGLEQTIADEEEVIRVNEQTLLDIATAQRRPFDKEAEYRAVYERLERLEREIYASEVKAEAGVVVEEATSQ